MTLKPNIALLGACAFLPGIVLGQFTISGIADKQTPNDSATFTINTQAGFNYDATLNWKPIATGTPVVVNRPDFYELRVNATNQNTSAVTSQYLRFIINASERAGTEMGLPPHVPFPVIQSAASEFTGAHLRFILPASFPVGYPMPMVAWAMNDQDHPIRANGLLKNSGLALFQVKRGVGSGFASPNNSGGMLNLNLQLGDAPATNISVALETNITWTTVSGTLNGATVWPENSRIHVTNGMTIPNGSSLTVGAGSIVRLNARADITNNGTVTVNGALTNPVVFMPAISGQPWGGFVMKVSNQGTVNATATIFTGSGAEPNWFGANGNPGSHRNEQALFFCQAGQKLNLTNSAAMYLAGQLGHSVGAVTVLNLDHFLMQRTTTGGEWTGANFTVNDSAFIECPDDSVDFVDGDHDALYLVSGTHAFTNTLFGWTKDDGIDSGGDGLGRLHYQDCWFEGMFHEGNSLSGLKNTTAFGTVYLDCGQGIENGYGPASSTFGPTGRVENCLFMNCQSGVRHGDNYASIGNGYPGYMTATNCVSIYNHRDLFGFNWRSTGWTNAFGQFFVSNNLVSAFDTNYPNNTLWNPAADAWRLGAFGGVGRVGVGFGVRNTSLVNNPDGVAVGLSRFCTNEVQVDYVVDSSDGTHLTGILLFPQGLTRRFISVPTNLTGFVRVVLSNPQNADVTGNSAIYFANPAPFTPAGALSPLGANWKYLDNGSEQGSGWRANSFDDSAWSSGVARLGFGPDPAPLGTTIRRFVTGTSGPQITNFYFRRAFTVTNLSAFTNLQFRYQRDDGCIVYLNTNEMFRNNMAGSGVTANSFATTNNGNATATLLWHTNIVSVNNLLTGTNVVAVEVHQSSATSSDLAWEMELQGLGPSQGPRLNLAVFDGDAVLYWNDPAFVLEEADFVTGPWRPSTYAQSPAGAPLTGNRFFRLRK